MRFWKPLTVVTVSLALLLSASPGLAKERAQVTEKAESCGLKGTWFGFNNHGNNLVGTVARTGRGTYSVVFDSGASLIPGAEAGTNWRGEIVKIGAKKYRLTVMAFFPLEEEVGLPLGMGYCSVTSKKMGCSLLEGKGTCGFYGFFHGQNPFTEGIPLGEPSRLKNAFHRMPVMDPANP